MRARWPKSGGKKEEQQPPARLAGSVRFHPCTNNSARRKSKASHMLCVYYSSQYSASSVNETSSLREDASRSMRLIPWPSTTTTSNNRRQCKRNRCSCHLCLELNDSTMTTLQANNNNPLDNNFILRRQLPLVERTPTREWQEASDEDDDEDEDVEYTRRTTLPEVANRHKSVVPVCYFGDTMEKPPVPKPRVTADSKSVLADYRDDKVIVKVEAEDTTRLADNEIVISVKPCREDVIRIEQDESKLEEYWSLPGDTTGFKADWSFVQQWRLRGYNIKTFFF